MAEFTPITTQEQFDAAIGERLKREREALAKKYGDYDELRAKTADQEKQIGELTRSLTESSEKYAGYDKTLAELQAKLKGYETDSVKTRIALEAGLPYTMASRLCGESEEDIRADARSLASLMGTGHTEAAPLHTGEPAGSSAKRDALRALNVQLNDND